MAGVGVELALFGAGRTKHQHGLLEQDQGCSASPTMGTRGLPRFGRQPPEFQEQEMSGRRHR